MMILMSYSCWYWNINVTASVILSITLISYCRWYQHHILDDTGIILLMFLVSYCWFYWYLLLFLVSYCQWYNIITHYILWAEQARRANFGKKWKGKNCLLRQGKDRYQSLLFSQITWTFFNEFSSLLVYIEKSVWLISLLLSALRVYVASLTDTYWTLLIICSTF